MGYFFFHFASFSHGFKLVNYSLPLDKFQNKKIIIKNKISLETVALARCLKFSHFMHGKSDRKKRIFNVLRGPSKI